MIHMTNFLAVRLMLNHNMKMSGFQTKNQWSPTLNRWMTILENSQMDSDILSPLQATNQ